MITLEQLLALLSDNNEALTFVNSLNDKSKNSEELVTKIGTLESQKTEIINSRKNQDTKYKEMLSLLGVEELTPEAVESFKKTGKGDEALKAEIDNLKGLLTKATDESKTVTSDYEGKLQSMALKNALARAGSGVNAASEEMYDLIVGIVSEGAVFENDTVTYKKGDVTIYGDDNKPLTLEGKLSQLQSNENYIGLFKPDIKNGTETHPDQNRKSVPNDTKGLSGIELMKAGRKATA